MNAPVLLKLLPGSRQRWLLVWSALFNLLGVLAVWRLGLPFGFVLQILAGSLAMAGLGGLVGQLQRTSFSWTLPGVRRSMVVQLLLLSALFVSPISLAALALARVGVGSAFFLFALGWWAGALCCWASADSSSEKKSLVMLIYAGGLNVWLNLPYLDHDWRWAISLWLIALLLYFATVSRSAARQRICATSRLGARGSASKTRPGTRSSLRFLPESWRGTLPVATAFTGRSGLLRAIFYESKGGWIVRWVVAILISLVAGGLWLLAWSFVFLRLPPTSSENWLQAVRLLTVDSPAAMYVQEVLILLLYSWIAVENFPRPSLTWRYPRSRKALADAVFASRLVLTLCFALVVSMLLLGLDLTTELFGEAVSGRLADSLLRAFTILLVFVPLGQWMRGVRRKAGKTPSAVLTWLLPIMFVLMVAPVLDLPRDLSWHKGAVIFLIAGLTQLLTWWGLRRHFRDADLI